MNLCKNGHNLDETLKIENGVKRCRICRNESAKRSRDKCKERQRLWQRNSYKNNPDTWKSKALKLKFGITLEQFNQMYNDQQGKCKICNRTSEETGDSRRLAVDHCHKTGIIRGLLCGNCNRGLGAFQDSEELLALAAKYLSNSCISPDFW